MSAPDLVPELLVTDVANSLEFWCRLCGFTIEYERPEVGFAYITRDNVHVMLEQHIIGRNWVTGELKPPFGRGINFQIGVADLEPILVALKRAQWPLFKQPETQWYRVNQREEVGVQQFLVMDPDGYLIRFQTSIGRREI